MFRSTQHQETVLLSAPFPCASMETKNTTGSGNLKPQAPRDSCFRLRPMPCTSLHQHEGAQKQPFFPRTSRRLVKVCKSQLNTTRTTWNIMDQLCDTMCNRTTLHNCTEGNLRMLKQQTASVCKDTQGLLASNGADSLSLKLRCQPDPVQGSSWQVSPSVP